MSAPDIVIVYAYLDSLSESARTTANSMKNDSTLMRLSFGENRAVDNAYDDFNNEWDKHREKLAEGIGAMAEAFAAVVEAFEGAEDELIAVLEGD